ncbi:hypothetical protein AWF34_03440 [Escherichia coli]|uniref:HAD-IIB family hydrolase n=1 Tax=Escherichia coli TaxID=562 RepID=UPI0007513833|nr:HAD-IIB family hydrolase [Escherichia coli]KUU98419.1 hypothetical protein AWF34_03440 [Escherichia coli]
MARLAAFDMDGTLLMPDHHLGEKTLSTLARLRERDITLTFATGRHALEMQHILGALSLDAYLITGNGTRVHSLEGELLHRDDLPADVAELVRLESHDYYHLRHPLLKAVEYWITPPLFEKDLGTSCRHPVQITIGKPEELQRVSQVSSGISLGFCYLTLRKSPRLSLWQARKVISIIHQSGLLQTLEVGENLITASHALLPGWTIPQWQVPDEVKLPKTLTLVYHLPIELHTMAERLQATLAAEGCELTIIFHNAKNWDDTTLLAHADLMMGDRLIGEAPEYTLEQWLRCDPLWPHVFDAPAYAHLQSTLDAVQVMPDEENRFNALKAVFSQLMADATLTPLFNYHYRISAPPGVNGVRLTPRGWFEFTEAWLPAPSQ